MDSEANANWFYSGGDERKGPFSKEQISALLSAGVLNEHSKVWSEALAEWTPLFRTELRTLLGERAIAPPEIAPAAAQTATPASVTVSQTYPVYDNRTLGDALYWSLCVLGLIQLAILIVVMNASGLERKMAWVRLLESNQTLALLAIPFTVGAVLFLMWKYRATANAFRLAGPQSITPRGAVYWYFVPVAFFWKPLEAMRNLHDAFLGTREYRPLYEWWAAWVASLVIPLVALALHGEATVDTTSSPGNYVFWKIASEAANGVAFYCAAKLVRTLTRAEAAKMGAA